VLKKEIDFPPGWGQDRITAFLELARQNELATFANLRKEYGKLRDIENELFLLIDNLRNAQPFHVGFFVLKAHCSFLGAIRCAMAGHVVETYPLLRACIEATLYALFLAGHEDRMLVWLKRNESQKAKQEVRDSFAFGKLRAELELRDSKLGSIAQVLYDECIDLGAHPNVGMLANMEIVDEEDSLTWKLKYLNVDDLPLRAVLKSTAQTGLLALEVCCLIYPQRVAILGIVDRMPTLRVGL